METGLSVDFVDFSALLSLSLLLFVHVNDGTSIKFIQVLYTVKIFAILKNLILNLITYIYLTNEKKTQLSR